MNELAGGFYRGDRVLCDGRPGMIFGKPARAACVRISVSVMYDDGTALWPVGAVHSRRCRSSDPSSVIL